MIPLQLEEVRNAINGKFFGAGNLRLITGFSTDSRTIKKGDLFVALKGENFDGHNFVADVSKKGASCVVISRTTPFTRRKSNSISIIKVVDTLKALGDIARYYRSKLSCKVIAIGGSNGKTTIKDMVAHILSKEYKVTKSPKSFNNFIGLPLTILSADRETEYLVAEVGTSKPGEIRYLANILKPDIALISNISETHLEELKNLQGVFKEESSLFNVLSENNIAIFDNDNKQLKRLTKYAEYKRVTFGMNKNADIRAGEIKIKSDAIYFSVLIQNRRPYNCRLAALGSWNVKNALAAFAISYTLGIKPENISKALKDFRPPEMRMRKEVIDGVKFINDAYNANPASVSLLIDDFCRMRTPSRKVFVFGEMRELGRFSKKCHQKVAEQIAKSNIDILFAIGKATKWTIEKLSRFSGIKHTILPFYFQNTEDAIGVIKRIINKDDTVVLKGSRVNRLEKVIECYTN